MVPGNSGNRMGGFNKVGNTGQKCTGPYFSKKTEKRKIKKDHNNLLGLFEVRRKIRKLTTII